MEKETDKIHQEYFETQFVDTHNTKNIEGEYKKFFQFFKYNHFKYLPKNKDLKIIDIGCGLGHTLYSLKRLGYQNVLGVDLSRGCVDFCRSHGFKVEEADANHFFEAKANEFDVVIMNDLLEHIEKEKIVNFLSEIRGSLRENGILIIKTLNAANGILGLDGRYMDFTHTVIFSPNSLRQVLALAEFSQIRIYPSNLFVFYKNPLNYFAWLLNSLFNFSLKCYFRLNGKMTGNIFTKNIISVSKK